MNSPSYQEIAPNVIDPQSSKNITTLPINEPQEEILPTLDDSDLKSLYGRYMQDSSKENLFKVVSKLNPLIGNTLNQLGEGNNNLLRNEAMLITADAVRTFNPTSGAALQTWAASQLRQLRRKRREINSPVKLPERVQIDAFSIERGIRELTDLKGEEPDLDELADHIKMPIKRIQKVRSMLFKTPESGALSGDSINQSQVDYTEEAMHYVYNDAGKLDRKIMEYRLGYGGSPPLSNNQIAEKLAIGPDVISKRLGRILKRVNNTYNLLSS